MKITKRQLRRIIKEEYTRILNEMGHAQPPAGMHAVDRQEIVDYLIMAIDDLGDRAYSMSKLRLLGYLRRMKIEVGGVLLTPTDEEVMEAIESA